MNISGLELSILLPAFLAGLLVIGLVGGCGTAPPRATVTVFAAASLKKTFTVIGELDWTGAEARAWIAPLL